MKFFFTILNIIFVTFIVYLTASLIYKVPSLMLKNFFTYPQEKAESRSSLNNIKELSSLKDYNFINQRNLFNLSLKEPKQVVQEKINVDDLKQTNLSLKLWGTITGKRAFAVIEDTKTKKQKLYKQGESVQNALIKAILREQVILSVNNKDEILNMEKTVSSSSRFSRPSSKLSNRYSANLTDVGKTQKINIKRSQINESLDNLNDLMNDVSVKPFFEAGQPAGLLLSRIKPSSIFRKMGLRSGDVIKGVNGEEIRSVEDALSFYKDLTDASSVQLQIKRRNRLKNIEYNIK